jgi:hypothetical protein
MHLLHKAKTSYILKRREYVDLKSNIEESATAGNGDCRNTVRDGKKSIYTMHFTNK